MEAAKLLMILAVASTCSWGCGCIDQGTAGQQDQQAQQNYNTGDTKMLDEIKKIGTMLHNAYQNLENDSAHNVETSLRLKNAETVMEKEILFNEKIINRLTSVMSDSISTGTEMKALKEVNK